MLARQIVGVGILSVPAILMIWGWLRVLFKRPSDPPIRSWVPSVLFLFLMTMSYGLTLAQIFDANIERYFFALWHANDLALYCLVSLFGCVIGSVSKSPIRWQVFSSGVVLTILYFAAGYSMAD